MLGIFWKALFKIKQLKIFVDLSLALKKFKAAEFLGNFSG